MKVIGENPLLLLRNLKLFSNIKLNLKVTIIILIDVAQLVGHCPIKQKVISLIPGQGTHA